MTGSTNQGPKQGDRAEELPRAVDHLLRNWELPPKSDAAWEALAENVEHQIRDRSPGRGEGEDWLFLPPLPLQNGEPRRVNDQHDAPANIQEAPQNPSDHRSLKEIAADALRAVRAEAPARSHEPLAHEPLAPPFLGAMNELREEERASRIIHRGRPQQQEQDSPRSNASATAPSNVVSLQAARGERRTANAQTDVQASFQTSAQEGLRGANGPTPSRNAWPKKLWLWSGVAAVAAAASVWLFPGSIDDQTSVSLAPDGDRVARVIGERAQEMTRNVEDTLLEEVPHTIPAPVSPLASPASESTTTEEPESTESHPVAALAREPRRSRHRGIRSSSGGKRSPEAAESIAKAEEQDAPRGGVEPRLVPAAEATSLPDRPSIVEAQNAVGAVLGNARLCVVGQLSPSRAEVVFGSNGRVRHVVVSGPSKGTPTAECIRRSLSQAGVRPFTNDSFSVRVTVRP